eukprot:752115-Hanusia_phi.AAC.4
MRDRADNMVASSEWNRTKVSLGGLPQELTSVRQGRLVEAHNEEDQRKTSNGCCRSHQGRGVKDAAGV